MDWRHLLVYQIEVAKQTSFALIALSDVDTPFRQGIQEKFWHSVQSFLVAVGNVSKLLWPRPKDERISNRGAELRNSLRVPDNSPLEPRRFRNHFKHFDTRIDIWVNDSRSHNFIDTIIGPKNAVKGIEDSDAMRWYDQTAMTLCFQGEEYSLAPVVEAIRELYQKSFKVAFIDAMNLKPSTESSQVGESHA